MKITKKEHVEAMDSLSRLISKGDTVFTVLRHVSKSGMQREIGLVVIKQGDKVPIVYHPNYSAAKLLGLRLNRGGAYDAIIVKGCGMDMGFHLVEGLSRAMFGEGDALRQQWL